MTKMNILNRIPSWESHLVARAKSGEYVAFEVLIEHHRPSMLAHAKRFLRNADDACDVVQDATLKAYKAIATFQTGKPVLPWLLRIVSNCCVDLMRSRKVRLEAIDTFEYSLCDTADSAEETLQDEVDAVAVRQAIGKLPKVYQQIIQMRHFGDMEVSEIARELHKPEGTIKSWLFRARALLRKELEPTLLAS